MAVVSPALSRSSSASDLELEAAPAVDSSSRKAESDCSLCEAVECGQSQRIDYPTRWAKLSTCSASTSKSLGETSIYEKYRRDWTAIGDNAHNRLSICSASTVRSTEEIPTLERNTRDWKSAVVARLSTCSGSTCKSNVETSIYDKYSCDWAQLGARSALKADGSLSSSRSSLSAPQAGELNASGHLLADSLVPVQEDTLKPELSVFLRYNPARLEDWTVDDVMRWALFMSPQPDMAPCMQAHAINGIVLKSLTYADLTTMTTAPDAGIRYFLHNRDELVQQLEQGCRPAESPCSEHDISATDTLLGTGLSDTTKTPREMQRSLMSPMNLNIPTPLRAGARALQESTPHADAWSSEQQTRSPNLVRQRGFDLLPKLCTEPIVLESCAVQSKATEDEACIKEEAVNTLKGEGPVKLTSRTTFAPSARSSTSSSQDDSWSYTSSCDLETARTHNTKSSATHQNVVQNVVRSHSWAPGASWPGSLSQKSISAKDLLGFDRCTASTRSTSRLGCTLSGGTLLSSSTSARSVPHLGISPWTFEAHKPVVHAVATSTSPTPSEVSYPVSARIPNPHRSVWAEVIVAVQPPSRSQDRATPQQHVQPCAVPVVSRIRKESCPDDPDTMVHRRVQSWAPPISKPVSNSADNGPGRSGSLEADGAHKATHACEPLSLCQVASVAKERARSWTPGVVRRPLSPSRVTSVARERAKGWTKAVMDHLSKVREGAHSTDQAEHSLSNHGRPPLPPLPALPPPMPAERSHSWTPGVIRPTSPSPRDGCVETSRRSSSRHAMERIMAKRAEAWGSAVASAMEEGHVRTARSTSARARRSSCCCD